MELEWSSTWFWCQWNHKKSLHWSIKWLQWVCNSFGNDWCSQARFINEMTLLVARFSQSEGKLTVFIWKPFQEMYHQENLTRCIMICMEMLLLHPIGMLSVMMEFSTKKMQKNSYSQVTRHTKDQWFLGQYPSKGHFSILIQNGTRINSKVAIFEIFFHSSHRNGCINHI